ncbi:MAG: aminopeptidase N [Candidatus Omnitrophica bacterium]|nr:aminopeptidase N [Candidatus Omnitrophota bacterium]
MNQSVRKEIYLKDYCPPAYRILHADLCFDLYEDKTLVESCLQIKKAEHITPGTELALNGEKLNLLAVEMDGRALDQTHYRLSETRLILINPPETFELKIVTQIDPKKNYALEGLYQSNGIFCTQNESEGFRKITYYLDRPDVMATFTTTIRADKKRYPVLLSNGNPVGSGDLESGRHFVTWKDPFAKPCYLFALVAGDLAVHQDVFKTKSGRDIDLRIYVQHGKEDQTAHAMGSLKRAMKWDEDTFGLECDLDTYMIVAVDDFNFGAMENKGLNIFNSQYILARPESATDLDYQQIEGVIGHEYFHNWTGNRVTCRDWFQITLKEGLTVFRDQEFSCDMGARAVKRIADVRILRDYQFVEDAGPNAHPIKPPSYIEINNFYTATVYNKGAEVIRMIDTLIGRAAFCKGITKYFELYDGQAVTTEDFVHAMELASGRDLTQFKNWYDQAGTPVCKVSSDYDEKTRTYKLNVKQRPPVSVSHETKPYYFPLVTGFLDREGRDIPLELEGKSDSPIASVLCISKSEEDFYFKNLVSRPVPSLLRNFSAPVRLEYDYAQDDLVHLLAYDRDEFNRYEAGQRLAASAMNRLITVFQNAGEPSIDEGILEAFGKLITDEGIDPAFKAEALIMPSLTALTEPMPICDFDSAFIAREFFLSALAKKYEAEFLRMYETLHCPGEPYQVTSEAVGKRSLKNRSLFYLSILETSQYAELILEQLKTASNMTDQIAALSALCQMRSHEKQEGIEFFYERWKDNGLVLNKWFAAQASSKNADVLKSVKRLENHPAFDKKNPNKIRVLFGVFAQNLIHFHHISGQGYAYIADQIIEIDQFNPKSAAGLARAFNKYQRINAARQAAMRKELERILAQKNLSPDVYEIVSNIVKSAADQKRDRA